MFPMIAAAWHTLLANQAALTGVGLAVSGGIIYELRKLPEAFKNRFIGLFTVELKVMSTQECFGGLDRWIAQQQDCVRSRAARVYPVEVYDNQDTAWKTRLTLGDGWHRITFEGKLILVFRHTKDEPMGGMDGYKPQVMQTIWLHAIGKRNAHAVLQRILTQAENSKTEPGYVRTKLFAFGSYYDSPQRHRPADTVYLPGAIKTRVFDAIDRWQAEKERYHCLGIPHRIGIYAHGPSGTGKSSLATAIATRYNLAIYVIDLSSVASNDALVSAFQGISGPALVLIEEIDTLASTRQRGPEAQEGEPVPGVSLGGLLNVIDGVGAREGRILMATTNHPDDLDEALLRPGRFDVKIEIGLMERPEALEMFLTINPTGNVARFLLDIEHELPIKPARLQGMLLEGRWSKDQSHG